MAETFANTAAIETGSSGGMNKWKLSMPPFVAVPLGWPVLSTFAEDINYWRKVGVEIGAVNALSF